MEELNVVNEAQEEVVVPSETEYTSESSEIGEREQEVAEPVQDREDNSRFAKVRRDAEAKAMEKAQGEADSRLQDYLKSAYADETLKSSQFKTEMEQYKSERREEIFSSDISEIKKKFPDETAKSVKGLGRDFITIMATGLFTATEAYEKALSKKTAKPKSTGGVTQTVSNRKDYYTSDELDRLTAKDLDNPKVMARALKSLSRI